MLIDAAAGAGLGHGQRADGAAGDQVREVPRLLLGRAVELQLVDAELGVRGIERAMGAAGARELFHDDAVRLVAEGG